MICPSPKLTSTLVSRLKLCHFESLNESSLTEKSKLSRLKSSIEVMSILAAVARSVSMLFACDCAAGPSPENSLYSYLAVRLVFSFGVHVNAGRIINVSLTPKFV